MKNIFKKNQIIITALAIMIVIAGYLSFTQKDVPTTGDNLGVSSEDYDEYTSLEGLDLATTTGGTTDGATDGNNTTTGVTGTDDVNLIDETTGTDETTGVNDETTGTDVTTPVDVEDNAEGTELGDISDEDLLEVAQNVADNGELEASDEEGVVGEAVLASTVLDSGFFITSKLEREQSRARIKTDLLAIMESTQLSEDAKQDAIDQMLDLTDNAAKENLTERLLEAKGYDGAMVYIIDGKADVVVNAASLSDQDLAIIEDVVKRKTDLPPENIAIAHVVIEE